MAVREILIFPKDETALRRQSQPVTHLDKHVRRLIRDLNDTLEAHQEGIGLAAPQIGVHRRVVLVCFGSEVEGSWQAGPPVALINPRIEETGDERKDFDGCLSFPGLYGETVRPHCLRITGMDENGESFDRAINDFNAVVTHHEIDHLDGVLFVDRIEKVEDLYRLSIDEDGNIVNVPVSVYWNT